MKKILLFIISILFTLTLTSCGANYGAASPYEVPRFNEVFTIAGTDIKGLITNNTEEQRFELIMSPKSTKNHKNDYVVLTICYINEFNGCSYSWFSSDSWRGGVLGGNYEELKLNAEYSDSSVVEYTDDIPHINGDTTLYISYKDLDDEIKEVFLNDQYSGYNPYYEIGEEEIYYFVTINMTEVRK